MALKMHASLAVHPGDWIKTELVETRGLKVGDLADHLGVTRQTVSRLLNQRQVLTADMAIRFEKLFGHTARGTVCPYETEYGQEGLFEQPRQLATIMGYYQAFGLTTRTEERERADHAGCELEFLDFLCRKEAYAIESGDEAMRSETRKAQRLFLKDHLGRFGRAFARLLREQEPDGFFGGLGDLLFAFLTWEYGRFRIEPGAVVLPLRSAEDDAVPMACGGQQDLIQLGVPR